MTSQRTMAHAELEIASAGTFRREPASWAVDMVAERSDPHRGALREAFRAAGFDDAGVAEGMRRMASGTYFSFEDAALSLCTFDRVGPRTFVTSLRIAEAAAKLPGRHVLTERRTATQVRPRLVESATARQVGDAVLEACLITTGTGSSGVYPTTTLQEAAREKVFHKGVHCYLDHPTASEQIERPERSVRDLAGCLESDASYRDGGLWATIRVFASHREFVTERAAAIGLSIRADGEVSERAAASGQPTISRLVKAHSVDFVTHAGRGGRIQSWT